MTITAVRHRLLPALAAVCVLSLAGAAGAAGAPGVPGAPGGNVQRPAASSPERSVAAERGQAGSAADPLREDADAGETRDQLQTLLEKYPPTLAIVLKADPSLMTNEAYLTPYPALAAFLARHPGIAHNPGYFLANVQNANGWNQPYQRSRVLDFVAAVTGGAAALCVFVVILMTLGWLIRTTLNYRRWNRLSKIQTDVHTKLLDRFSSSEDLLAYMQTPGARRFLESAPIPLDNEARPLSAPLSRILWSLQVGVVLLVFGTGVLMLSSRVILELQTAFAAFGILAIALGAGFALSAFAAYAASRRLGLLEPAAGAPEGRV